MAEIHVLVVDDEQEVRTFFRHLLSRKGYVITTAASAAEALEAFEKRSFDLALVDLKLPDQDGLSLMRTMKREDPACEVIIMTGYSTIKSAVEAIQWGAYDYIEKPFEIIDDLEAVIDKAIQTARIPRDWKEVNEQFGFVVGQSYAMRRLISLAEKVARKNITVLIQGETGTGKEVLARFIHGISHRAQHPFIAVNCGGFTETLLESELFGHERGSFTGAVALRRGVFELADQGTLFLDEIGVASQAIQIKLLRVLETGEFFRVGGEKPLKTDVRIIAAANTDLKDEVAKGNFREDLFYRLDVATLHIPPLRERREDIPIFVSYFVNKAVREAGKQGLRVSPEAMELLKNYDWPGNIRELLNVITQAVALCDGSIIQEHHLPDKIVARKERVTAAAVKLDDQVPPSGIMGTSLENAIETLVERIIDEVDVRRGVNLPIILDNLKMAESRLAKGIIHKALRETMGDRQKASELLGITPRVLRYLLKERPKAIESRLESNA